MGWLTTKNQGRSTLLVGENVYVYTLALFLDFYHPPVFGRLKPATIVAMERPGMFYPLNANL